MIRHGRIELPRSRACSTRSSLGRSCVVVAWLMMVPAAMFAAPPEGSKTEESAERFTLESIRGRVVWLSAALARKYQVKEVPEVAERVLALEDKQGTLHPLVEDVRGRAFRRDPRLRQLDLELLIRRYTGSPFVQVVQVFELREGRRYEIDYWCEICSIAMFELKDCECCQQPIELRRRLVPAAPKKP